MLSKKRQIMFDILGKSRAQRVVEVSPLVRTEQQWSELTRGEQPRPAPPRAPKPPKPPRAPRPARAPKRPAMRRALPIRGRAWWLAAAGVALLAVVFVAWRVHKTSGPKAPVLQSNAEAKASTAAPALTPGESWSADVYAVCAMSEDYRNKAEKKQAAERVQEAVDFCYRADPDFRDVRGIHTPGKDQDTGTYRVYVGSAKSKSDLAELKVKLAAKVWNGRKPFQKATVRMIERVSPTTAKEASDER